MKIVGLRHPPFQGISLLLFFIFAAAAADLAPQFDAQRAYSHVQKQVEFGPRPSGSRALEECRRYLISQLQSQGWTVREQIFEEATPRGPIRFANVIAARPRSFPLSWLDRNLSTLILATHYDTKWMADKHFVGANDGASSTGILLEMARVIAQSQFQPAQNRIELVFFDGEEAAQSYTFSEGQGPSDGLHGSRFYVRQAKREAKPNKLTRLRGMILMDMVGDRDLSVRIPRGDPDLTSRLFAASEALGYRHFFQPSPYPMIDDHHPFVLEGVPSIDLIDFEYGPRHQWWHTEEDRLDKISPQSLKIVGQTVLKMLEGF